MRFDDGDTFRSLAIRVDGLVPVREQHQMGRYAKPEAAGYDFMPSDLQRFARGLAALLRNNGVG